MFLVLFTLFCITTYSIVAPPPAGQPAVCWTKQRDDTTFSAKQGSPKGWCDRILYLTKGKMETKIQPSDYNAIGNWAIAESDHDLVAAYYNILKTGKYPKGPKKGKKKTEKLFNVLSVTFNIGDKKKKDQIKGRFDAIMCSLKAKYVTNWRKIDIFHFAFQEAKAWWDKGDQKPKFPFAETLTKQVTAPKKWAAKYKYQGDQGALLYVYYNTAKITYISAGASVNTASSGHFYDANKPQSPQDKSFAMLGHFCPVTEQGQLTKKQHFIVFATAHFPKEKDDDRIEALKQIEKKFKTYNGNLRENVILILGADTNFRDEESSEHFELKQYLAGGSKPKTNIMNWKEIAKPTFKKTCKRKDKIKLYEGEPAHECKSGVLTKAPKDVQCWSKCTSDAADQLYTLCTKKYKRRATTKTTKAWGCKRNEVRVLCDKKIPTCDKDKNAPQCLSKVAETSETGKSTCQQDSRVLKTPVVAYKWLKGSSPGTRWGSSKTCCYRFLCGQKTQQGGDITPWNDNNYIHNPSTSSSYYMYFMTMAILLMIIILCGIFGLCVGSICFVGAYYYGQRSVKKVNQMDEKYP